MIIFGYEIIIKKIYPTKWEHYIIVREKRQDRYKNIIYIDGKRYKGKEFSLDFWVGKKI